MTPIALLHGGGQGSWEWDDTRAVLEARGARVLCLDVPGCGTKREREIGHITADAVATELVADILAAGFKQVLLAGHSLAGTLMPLMARQKPELFARLVYIGCVAPENGISIIEHRGTRRFGEEDGKVGWPVDPATHTVEQRYRAMFCNDMDAASANAFLGLLGCDNWPMDVVTRSSWTYDHLAAIPSTFVLLERDQAGPPHWQAVYANRFRCSRTIRLDAGHQAMNTQPAVLADILLEEAGAQKR